MKNLFYYCSLMLAMVLLSACDQKLETEVSPDLSLNLSTDSAPDRLYGEVRVTAMVDLPDATRKVVFLLGNTLLGEDVSAPFEVVMHTEEFPDGAAVLKAIAYNQDEKEFSAELPVTISNMLLTITVTPAARPMDESWLYVTDKDGQMLQAPVMLQGNQEISIRRPAGYTSDSTNIFIVRLHEQIYFLTNYYHVQTNKLQVPQAYYTEPEPATLQEVSGSIFNDIPLEISHYVFTNSAAVRDHIYNYTDIPVRFPFRGDGSHAFNYYAGVNEMYYTSYFLTPGNSPLQVRTSTYQQAHRKDYSLNGFTEMASAMRGYKEGRRMGNIFLTHTYPYSTILPIYSTADFFDSVSYVVELVDSDRMYYMEHRDVRPSSIQLPVHKIITVAQGFHGATHLLMKPVEADYVGVFWADLYNQQNPRYVYVCNYYPASKELTYYRPEIPQFLMERYPALQIAMKAPLYGIELVDYDRLNGYLSFMQNQINFTLPRSNIQVSAVNTRAFSEDGRISPKQAAQSWQLLSDQQGGPILGRGIRQ